MKALSISELGQQLEQNMAVSIADVASRANVSISTVSRVINGRAVVNEETKKRVEAAIAELGYRPNVYARGLMLKKPRVLGLMLPDIHGEFYSEIIRGANAKARQLGYHLLVSSIENEDDGETVLSAISDQLLSSGVAIMISDVNAATRESLSRVTLPTVVLDGNVDGVRHDTVVIDQRQGAINMMRHLVAGGEVDRIVFISGGETNIDSTDRYQAYLDVMCEAGLPVSDADVHHLDFQYATAFAVASEHIRDWASPRTCVFAANDEMAAGIVYAAGLHGISIPTQLRVVGFDDIRIAKMMTPRLTTVRVPMSEMGATAIELLSQRLQEPERPRVRVSLQSELVIRESCGLGTSSVER